MFRLRLVVQQNAPRYSGRCFADGALKVAFIAVLRFEIVVLTQKKTDPRARSGRLPPVITFSRVRSVAASAKAPNARKPSARTWAPGAMCPSRKAATCSAVNEGTTFIVT